MGRNRGFTAALIQIQREAERQRKAQLAAATRAAKEAERAHRAYERAQAAEAKERQRLHIQKTARQSACETCKTMHPRRDQGEQLLTPVQAAAYLNISYRTLAAWRQHGIGPPSITLPSGVRRYRKADLDQWIADHRQDG